MMMEIPPFWEGARRLPAGVDLHDLAQRAGGYEALQGCSRADLEELGVPGEFASRWVEHPPGRTRGRALTLVDPEYPSRLREVPGAPAVLCVEGDVGVLEASAVAVVGTRRCTPYGTAVAHHLSQALSRRGVVVVSGMARGIDTHAHRAALRDGRTVAVFGHGLAHTAPRSNQRLRDEIVDGGGAVVTAFPDDLEPARWTFPVRNTWIAALSDHTVVVEAPLRSGALITATEAAGMGREVWAVPGALGCATSAGCLSLIARGAGIIDDVEGWADRFGVVVGSELEPLLGCLQQGATVEEACRRIGRPLTWVLARLASLEVEGRVVRLPGNRYAPTTTARDPGPEALP